MEKRTPIFGKSPSMPALRQSPQRDDQTAYGNQFRAIQDSPVFQSFERSQATNIWAPQSTDFPGSGTPWRFGDNQDHSSNGMRPTSETTVLLDAKGSSHPEFRPGSADSGITVVLRHVGNLGRKLPKASLGTKISADAPVFRPQARPGIYASGGPPPRRYTEIELLALIPRSSSNTGSVSIASINGHSQPASNSQSQSVSEGSADSNGCKTPTKNWLPGLGHPSLVTNKPSPRKDLYVPGGSSHHRRTSSRVSSLPAIPSPLGPKHYVDDLGSDVSGLVSPLPASPNLKSCIQEMEDEDDMEIFGLDTPVRPGNGQGTPLSKRNDFGFGHGRNITDPFVDYANTYDDLPQPSAFMTKALPLRSPGGWAAHKEQLRTRATASSQGFSPTALYIETPSPRKPDFRLNESTTPKTPSFWSSIQPTPRVDLPIPPPPLSSVQGQLFHTPATRARLDTQAQVRAEWIKTEAKKIVDLSRLSFAAAQQYQQTGSQEDYEQWQKFSAAYDDATNLEKRQEERRNMFMPESMKAMKTGVDNVGGDQSVSFTNSYSAADGDASQGQGQGQLLGHRMAFMERICAETMRRGDEKEETETQYKDGEITPEMLATLNVGERKDLRDHLIGRLTKAMEKRFL